jgi:ATP:corrinoid adenosyltransferase
MSSENGCKERMRRKKAVVKHAFQAGVRAQKGVEF